jgi:hypothetical protein
MSNIHNITGLRAEISRLQNQAKEQEQLLKNDLLQIREKLKPANLLSNAFTSVTGIKFGKNNLFKDGVAIGLSLLLQRYIFKTERKIESKLIDYLGQILEKIKQTIHSFTHKDETH